MNLKPDDIKKVVLEEDDFGHEMRVGSILRSIKYPRIQYDQIYAMPPEHGGTYSDPETSKPRQYDYRCLVVRAKTQRVHLAVECKNLNPSSPMVVCGRPRVNGEDYHVFIASEEKIISHTRKVDGFASLYKPEGFVGKSILRLENKSGKLSTKNDGDIYDRWAQALASSFELAQIAFHDLRMEAKSFILPLVVVPNNSLWIANYDENGTFNKEPVQVDECEFYVDRQFDLGRKFVLTHIHFVTLKGLESMLSNLVDSRGRKWDEIFNPSSTVFHDWNKTVNR